MAPDTPVMHTMDHTEIGISTPGGPGGGRWGRMNVKYLENILEISRDTSGGSLSN